MSGKSFLKPIDERITLIANNCIHNLSIYDLRRASCLTYAGQLYAQVYQYKKALNCLNQASDIDPRISDPYFAIGNIYFDLSEVDLIKRKRFKIYPAEMRIELYPDERSKIIFNKTLEQYALGRSHNSYYYDLNKSQIILTSWSIVTEREKQMDEFFDGSRSINFDKIDMLNLAMMILIIS